MLDTLQQKSFTRVSDVHIMREFVIISNFAFRNTNGKLSSFLRVFFPPCFSPSENLVYNTKTRLSRVKSFFFFFCVRCAKETNRRKRKRFYNEKKRNKNWKQRGRESIYNKSKELLINFIKVHFFLVFGYLREG